MGTPSCLHGLDSGVCSDWPEGRRETFSNWPAALTRFKYCLFIKPYLHVFASSYKLVRWCIMFKTIFYKKLINQRAQLIYFKNFKSVLALSYLLLTFANIICIVFQVVTCVEVYFSHLHFAYPAFSSWQLPTEGVAHTTCTFLALSKVNINKYTVP